MLKDGRASVLSRLFPKKEVLLKTDDIASFISRGFLSKHIVPSFTFTIPVAKSKAVQSTAQKVRKHASLKAAPNIAVKNLVKRRFEAWVFLVWRCFLRRFAELLSGSVMSKNTEVFLLSLGLGEFTLTENFV